MGTKLGIASLKYRCPLPNRKRIPEIDHGGRLAFFLNRKRSYVGCRRDWERDISCMAFTQLTGRKPFQVCFQFFGGKRRFQGKLLPVYENGGGTPELIIHGFHGIIGKDVQVDGSSHVLLNFFGHAYGRLAAPSTGIAAVKHHYINHLFFLLSVPGF